MTSSGGDFKGTFDVLLPLHFIEIVGEGVELGIELLARVHLGGLKVFRPIEEAHDVVEMTDSIYFQAVDHSGFAGIGFGHKEGFVAPFTRLDGDGQNSLDGQDVAIKSQFAYKQVAFRALYLQKFIGTKHSDGHREVESRAFLAHIGWGEIDHHGLEGCLVTVHPKG